MSSREFDSMLDDLVRQALYPSGEAEPPVRVWRRVLRAVRSMKAESMAPAGLTVPASLLAPSLLGLAGLPAPASLLALAGLPVTFSRWLGFLSGMRKANVPYVPLFSNRSYYVDSSGRYLPSPFWDVALKQMFDLRLAS